MRGISPFNSPELPLTSFPIVGNTPSTGEQDYDLENLTFGQFLDSLYPILIISDASECNSNLSVFFKLAADYLKMQDETYHSCSIIALKFLNLNLFIKNHQFCLGKILGLMSVLSQSVAGDCTEDAITLKEVLLIIVLLLFKLCGEEAGDLILSLVISKEEILYTLRDLNFVEILSQFIAGHVRESDHSHVSYVILNFSCNIFFQYLYHIILLSDDEFYSLTRCALIPTLIDDFLSNDNFNNYNLAGKDFEDVSKLIAYEEFKLLLLINEQYMMRSISNKVSENKVIERLLITRKNSVNGICGFINLLVYHMNREESHIIRIQMLKFLYLILSSTNSCKVAYLNDLKILVDIIIRELDDLDYSSDKLSQENCLLALTYLKILHPLLIFTQLNNISPKYKVPQLIEVLSNVIMNCDVVPNETVYERNNEEEELDSYRRSILKTATRCLNISWLRVPRNSHSLKLSGLDSIHNSSSESLASASSLSSKVNELKLKVSSSNQSTDSFSLSRIASVRASSISDYNKHTTSHNLALEEEECQNIFEANNLNVFRLPTLAFQTPLRLSGPLSSIERCPSSAQTLGLLNLPKEYLSKSLPPLPKEATNSHENRSQNSVLQEKARWKKAPPPPPPPSRRRRHHN
ncbi:hypothetical protein METBIDRAFT_46564 [Metschnikowia bicuspidata var. bicuspidata NRRL YB-4993]|uniref:SPIN90/Ldb17 leucine-rich domain-containing protein n=1 Tax=Metschnikowia bicuspidata var. bicuspidata NRRL YB-4993 TaxID=869754 RepID=A0A1A0H5F2_9ASCO|nr:hypothetical protein METBIDRAFT_46564 [Metschnikowia bicuspidata var. bicuspidata NRRL YB-4993]OBA19266.1 hypothetical protein METBIDRAFT_46564 [Metschnikowia bicuspidata var. bicuspidata NRRL YB-4993]